MIVGGYAGLMLLYIHLKTPDVTPIISSKLDSFAVYCVANILMCSLKWMFLSMFMCWITA